MSNWATGQMITGERIRDGLLFRKGDSCDLLETIRWALKHPDEMQEMARNARLRVEDFSQEKIINETLSVLQQLHDVKRRRSVPRKAEGINRSKMR